MEYYGKEIYGEKLLSSAVNQVGRDLGKTISNQLFGDAHATPIRHIQSQHTLSDAGNVDLKSLPTEEMIAARRAQREAERRSAQQKIGIWGVVFAVILVSLLAAVLGI